MKRAIHIILCISCLCFMGCCFTPAVFLTRTCDGRIVDADTGAPIEGVVVLGVCYRESFIWATDTVNEFCGARETMTDKNGDFVIRGTDITAFKAGYKYIFFDPLHKKGDGKWMGVKWEGNKPIIPLKKLTMEERRRQGTPPAPPFDAPFEKVKLYLKERNKDRIDRGLKPLTLWGGVRYE